MRINSVNSTWPCTRSRCIRWSILAAFLLGTASAGAAQSRPEVLKVEPPNWWAGHSINPVHLLIHGRALAGARVETTGRDIRVGSTSVNQAGTYLFVDLMIDSRARPGPHPLTISTSDGAADAPFEISAPLASAGRFQGLTPDDVIYLIMPDRFSDGDPANNDPPQSRGLYDRSKSRYYHGGDLQGIINHLDYIKSLGVTAIWMTPIYDNVNHLNEREQYGGVPITDYHGYGAVDFYGVEEHFGTLAKLCELVDRAHSLGIKVIQDQVANHTGPYHPWVKDPPTPTWFNGTAEHHLNETWQTWTLADPRATYQAQRETLEGWFINILPDLNQNDKETSRYIIQNTLWWLGVAGFDAIRQDTLPYVPRAFWRDWSAAIKRAYPRVNLIGEVYDGDPALVSFFQGGAARFDGIDSGIDTVFDFPVFFPIRHAFAEGKPLREVEMMLARDRLYANPNILVTFLGLHDMLRFMSESGATIEGLKLAQTFLMTARGIPMLYYGDEIAMPGGPDPDNRRDFPGGFPGDPANAFDSAGRAPDQQSVFVHVQRLGRLRAQLEPLRRGTQIDLLTAEQQYVYARMTDRETAIVVLNNDSKPASLEFDAGPARVPGGATLYDQLGVAADIHLHGTIGTVSMPARAAAVFVPR
jgi:glycosidase